MWTVRGCDIEGFVKMALGCKTKDIWKQLFCNICMLMYKRCYHRYPCARSKKLLSSFAWNCQVWRKVSWKPESNIGRMLTRDLENTSLVTSFTEKICKKQMQCRLFYWYYRERVICYEYIHFQSYLKYKDDLQLRLFKKETLIIMNWLCVCIRVWRQLG